MWVTTKFRSKFVYRFIPSQFLDDAFEYGPRFLAIELLKGGSFEKKYKYGKYENRYNYTEKEDAMVEYIDDLCRIHLRGLTPDIMIEALAKERMLPYRKDREQMKNCCKYFIDWFTHIYSKYSEFDARCTYYGLISQRLEFTIWMGRHYKIIDGKLCEISKSNHL